MPRRYQAPDDAQPWDQQSGETALEFSRFCTFRDMGPTRSIGKMVATVGTSRTNIQNFADAHRWKERSAAWDRYQDREVQRVTVAQAVEMGKRHAEMARAHIAVLMAPAREMASRIQGGTLNMAGMSPGELITTVQRCAAVMKSLVEIERVSYGLPGSQAALSGPDGGPVKVQAMTAAESMRDLFEEAERVVAARADNARPVHEAGAAGAMILTVPAQDG
jgi:ABC-type multidrug transport system fused ATPase/permease subunit